MNPEEKSTEENGSEPLSADQIDEMADDDIMKNEWDRVEGWPRSDRYRFCPLSLEDWILLCCMADIPHVGANHVIDFERNDVMHYDKRGPHQQRIHTALELLKHFKRPNHMYRWDCCSDYYIKSSMAKGDFEWNEKFLEIDIGDIRTQEILYDYPRFVVPVFSRPWLTPWLIDNYPVEYRVYVDDGVIMGVSNYYPQRPIPEIPEHLKAVQDLTEKLMKHMPDPPWQVGNVVQQKDAHDLGSVMSGTPRMSDGIHFTADFIVSLEGEVLFLEGGPPHRIDYGAHPCCFLAGDIDGIALEDRNE